MRSLFVIVGALVFGALSLSAQTAPVITPVASLSAFDGSRITVSLFAESPNSSPVTWRIQVGTRSLNVDTSTGFAFFVSPGLHWTNGWIGPFTLADNGLPVTLFATNAYGTSSLPAGTLEVIGQKPLVSISTGSDTVQIGNDVVLSSNVRGSATLTYKWQKDGVDIPNATTATLILRAVQISHSGSYQLVVTNSLGTVTSNTIALQVVVVAPVILRPPQAASVLPGATASFQVLVSGSAPFTYQWHKDGEPLPDATNGTLTLPNVQAEHLGSYHVVVSNPSGTATSAAAALTLSSAPIVFTEQPRTTTVNAGATASFSAVVTGTGPITYQWRKDGTALAGATAATLTLASAQASDAGAYTVVATNAAGSVTSAPATLTVLVSPTVSVASPSRPLLGQAVTLQATATGSAPLAYQWSRNGIAISGATAATLPLPSVTVADRGAYTVTVTNAAGSTTSTAVDLPVLLPGRLVNLSLFTTLQAGESDFTLGVVLGGAGATGTKPLLLRAVGPSLSQFGLADVLADPKLELFASATATAENDDWGGAAALSTAAAQLGAFPLASPTSKDAALLAGTVALGTNSVKVSAAAGSTGAVLAELYDASPESGVTLATPRLVNISVLKPLGSGLTAGFAIGGSTDVTVLIRAIGPTLASFGVTNFAADPRLELRSGTRVVATNDNWSANPVLEAAFSQVGAFFLAAASRDAAIIATLAPGTYTVEVSAATGASGSVLVEIYEAPASQATR